jgi:hypothetical protein
MPKRTYCKLRLKLSPADRERTRVLLRRGREPARVLKRVSILSLLDKGASANTVSRWLDVSPTTVRAIARQYLQGGLDAAIFDRPRTYTLPFPKKM